MRTKAGERASRCCWCQDIAVIPMLALLPLLALPERADRGARARRRRRHGGIDLAYACRAGCGDQVVLGVIAGIVDRWAAFSDPAAVPLHRARRAAGDLHRRGAAAGDRDRAADVAGRPVARARHLPRGRGAGHQRVPARARIDIDPFKGLLLGLFFITVGAGIDFGLAARSRRRCCSGLAVTMAAKLAVLLLLGWLPPRRQALGCSA